MPDVDWPEEQDWQEDIFYRGHDRNGEGMRLARLLAANIAKVPAGLSEKEIAERARYGLRARALALRMVERDDAWRAEEAVRRAASNAKAAEWQRLRDIRSAADRVLEPKSLKCDGCRRNRWAIVVRAAEVPAFEPVYVDSDGNEYRFLSDARASGKEFVQQTAMKVLEKALCAGCAAGDTGRMHSSFRPETSVPTHKVGDRWVVESPWS